MSEGVMFLKIEEWKEKVMKGENKLKENAHARKIQRDRDLTVKERCRKRLYCKQMKEGKKVR